MKDFIIALDDPSILAQKQFIGSMKGRLCKPLLGCYNGVQEHSFLVAEEDRHLWEPWVSAQESWLSVTRCNKQYCVLHFDDHDVSVGCMHEITNEEAAAIQVTHEGGWSYDYAWGRYFTTKPGNPDGTPPPAGWQTDEQCDLHRAWLHGLNTAIDAQSTGNAHSAGTSALRNLRAHLMTEYEVDLYGNPKEN